MTISTKDINYYLPEELIATKPLPERDSSRLMIVSRKENSIKDSSFSDILNYIKEGDCLVLNDTKVFKARLRGKSKDGKNVELLLVRRLDEKNWLALLKNSKKFRAGTLLYLRGNEAEVLEKEREFRKICFKENLSFDLISKIGEVPLPPYIIKKRKRNKIPLLNQEDEFRYQSVVAVHYGSVAAPTASLHFTEELLEKIRARGVDIAYVTLHVGPGTFKPIDTEKVEDFEIHEEWTEVPDETIKVLQKCKKDNGRIIAVGTTVTRALESMALNSEKVEEWKSYTGNTRLFIKEGFKFKIVDALITNFHMPRSTLLLLVYAFGGKKLIRMAYDHAISEKYRFLSYGDAMFIY